MIDGGEKLSFTLEFTERLGVFGHAIGEYFERNLPFEPGVLGDINHSHPAAS